METYKKSCAFCNEQNKLTREHIFPNGVIRRFENEMLSLNDKTEKIFKSDLVVKDVCEVCNNGILSSLDSKFVKLFEDYMLNPIKPGNSVLFEFDYNNLLRELLKISYNSARASADGLEAVEALKKYIPYITGKKNDASDVALRLQIVTSSKQINPITNQVVGEMEAKILRSCKIKHNANENSNFIIRLLAFNSFWFYIIVPSNPTSTNKKTEFIKSFTNNFHISGVPIEAGMSSVSIPKEKTTYMHPSLFEGIKAKKL